MSERLRRRWWGLLGDLCITICWWFDDLGGWCYHRKGDPLPPSNRWATDEGGT